MAEYGSDGRTSIGLLESVERSQGIFHRNTTLSYCSSDKAQLDNEVM